MNKLTLKLRRKDAVNLIYICVAALFFYTFESGLIDLLKIVFLLGSLVAAALLIYNMNIKRGQKKLSFHLIIFIAIYNIILLLSSLLLGGIITFILGVAVMSIVIKIDE